MTATPPNSVLPSQPMTATHTPTPWRSCPHSQDIYADDVPKGPMRVADIRGWGYLTGKGHGALGLSDEVALATQKANAAFIVEAVNSHASLKARIQELEAALKLAEYVSRKDSLSEHERLESARTVICHALPPKSAK
jgi:hypothetical protein